MKKDTDVLSKQCNNCVGHVEHYSLAKCVSCQEWVAKTGAGGGSGRLHREETGRGRKI